LIRHQIINEEKKPTIMWCNWGKMHCIYMPCTCRHAISKYRCLPHES